MSKVTTRSRLPKVLHRLGLGVVAGSLIVWSGAAGAATPPESFSDLAKKVTPAVVNIASVRDVDAPRIPEFDLPFEFPEGSPFEEFFKQFRNRGEQERGAPRRQAKALGSGFIIDPSGYVVTNNHVVQGASDVEVRLGDNGVYPAEIVGIDSQTDLALLKIDAEDPLPAVAFGDSDSTEVGDWIMAVGNPFGLGGTVTAGIISARGRNIEAGPYDDFLQIDAPINQGNSGGPLFNLDGEVVGINTAIYSPNGGSVGIGFAIPSNLAKSVIADLREDGKVERGWLGVSIQTVTPDMASALGLDEPRGAIVAAVEPNGPADEAGIEAGDVILGFNGEEIEDARELARVVADAPVGESAAVSLWRDRKEISLTITAGEKPATERLATTEREPSDGMALHSEALQAELVSLTAERRAEFGIDEGVTGVLVLNVESRSGGGQGLLPGDVIKQIDQTVVESPQEVEAVVEGAKGEDGAVLMLISRRGQDLFVGVKLDVA